MAKRRTGLGRGLDALIPGSDAESRTTEGISRVDTGSIQPNPDQPRKNFEPSALQELSDSIKEHGILQPLIVTKHPNKDAYTLVAGERRLMAAKLAGLAQVPAIIRDVTEQERLELALIENVQRENLNPLESAVAFHRLVEEFSLSHENIAQRVGKSRTTITNTIRLLSLPETIQQALVDLQISEGHARALLGLKTAASQESALKTVLAKDLNVRQTEELVRTLTGVQTAEKPKAKKEQRLPHIEERLRSSLGTRVRVNHGKKGGAIVIHYYSDEELDTLLNILAPTNK